MFRNPTWAVLSVLGLGLLSASLRAEPQKSPAPAPAAATPGAPAQELSAAQRQQVEALRDKTERQLAPLREQLSARNKELFALWSVEPPNRTAILQKESEVAGLRQKARQVLVEQRLSYLALLTPAQRATWRSHAGGMGATGMGCCMQGGKEMGNMHGGGMGNMHGGGMGMGGPGGSPMGMDDCLDCMDCTHCDGAGACGAAAPSRPPSGAPAGPRPQ